MFARLCALGAGALMLAASSVNAAALTLTATAQLTTFGVFDNLVNGTRTPQSSGDIVHFTVNWDTLTSGDVLSLSCSDAARTFPSSFLIDGSAPWPTFTYTGQASGAYAPLLNIIDGGGPYKNRYSDSLITCTASCSNNTVTSSTITFFTGGVIELTSDVPSNVAVAGTAYTLTTTETPNNAIALAEGTGVDETFQISCGTGGGVLSVTGAPVTSQTWNSVNEATPQTVTWTAPTIPKTPITCTWTGPLPINPTNHFGLYDYFNMSTTFTMAIPTISVAAFTGTVTTGINTNLQVTLSEAATALQLTATCMSGGVTVATVVGTVTGTVVNFPFGATLTQAATGVMCTLARSGGDDKWTNSAASNSVGPFTIVLGADPASSTANAVAASSTANPAAASSAMGGASSSTGSGGCTGPTCAAPASLQAGVAMFVLAAAAILALMQ